MTNLDDFYNIQEDNLRQAMETPTIFDNIYTVPNGRKHQKKDWERISAENKAKKYLAVFTDFRKNLGVNIASYNCNTAEIDNYNKFEDIIKLSCNNENFVPVIYSKTPTLFIEVPEAVDRFFNLKHATKIQIMYKVGKRKITDYLYLISVPYELESRVKQLAGYQLAFLKARYSKHYELSPYEYYNAENKVKLKDTVILTQELLDVLIEIAKQVQEYQETLSGDLESFRVLKEPNFKSYRIGKSLLKNLFICEPITQEYFARLSSEKQQLIHDSVIMYKGLGMLSLDERRVLEAILIFICNSQIVYATEVPTVPLKFRINKTTFIKDIIVNRHLKNAKKLDDILEIMGYRKFVIPVMANYTNFQTAIITNLFKFEVENDSYIFTVSPFILKEVLAIKGSAFFVERERGFYDSCKGKVSMATYNLLDYLDYLRHQPCKDETIKMKAGLQTLLSRMGLLNSIEQGYRYIYTRFNKAIKIATEYGYIESYSISFDEFQRILKNKDTKSLGICIIRAVEYNDLSVDESEAVQDKKE